MGVKNAMPADRAVFDYYIKTVHRLFGAGASWCAAGIGPNQIVPNDWAVAAGRHARTGPEDNVRLDKTGLAPSPHQHRPAQSLVRGRRCPRRPRPA